MNVSSRFAVAVHILALMALETDKPQSSRAIAYSVNTNPVVIRRALGALSHAGLVVSQLGPDGGTSLARDAASITLLDVYRATETAPLWPLHHATPNPRCRCGRHIQPVLVGIFTEAEAAMQAALAQRTIAQVAQSIAARDQAEQGTPPFI